MSLRVHDDYASGPQTVLVKRTFLLACVRRSWWGGVGWAGGMLTFLVLRTLYVATLQGSLVLLLRWYTRRGGMGGVGWGRGPCKRSLYFVRYMLLRCRDLWCCCYTVYARSGGVGFKEQRSSPVCEMLAMAICESTYILGSSKNHFNAEAPALKRQ